MRPISISVFAAGLITACASVSPPIVGRYSLSPEALSRSGGHDIHAAIERLRPNWFGGPCLAVYRNERYWGGREALHEFSPEEAAAVNFIPSGHPRPGAGSTALNGCPAIQVVTAH